jgi:CheY-like chemotaxis protein
LITETKHIAFADDDYEDQEMLQQAIKKACPEIKFTLASNGAHLLDKLEATIPDFIILDINMPCMDGKECLKVIRSKRSIKDIPVMIYSTSRNKIDIEEVFLHGADYYVIKPNNIEALDKLASDICTGMIKSTITC